MQHRQLFGLAEAVGNPILNDTILNWAVGVLETLKVNAINSFLSRKPQLVNDKGNKCSCLPNQISSYL
jgi:hypothetical protein